MASEHADDCIRREGIEKSVKRRGILAAAGAVVAGMVAKQTDVSATLTPVYINAINNPTNQTSLTIANSTLSYADNYIFVVGCANSSLNFTAAISATGVGTGAGVQAEAGAAGIGLEASGGAGGIKGSATGTSAGVYGIGTSGFGVRGDSTGNNGVYATSGGDHAVFGNLTAAAAGKAGVFGYGDGGGTFGVLGDGFSGSGVGVQGQSNAVGGTGVKGISASGFPIIGNVTGIGSATNTAAGVLGAGTKGPGVQGQSTNGHGLVGTTDDGAGHAGLIGNATTAGGIGLMGIAPNYGQQTVGHAGEFYGNVKIFGGSLLAPVVQAAVKHQGDGSYRLLHTVTTPDGWCEDFGEASLTNSTATITLDADFAALIETTGYQVYLTEYGDHHSLFVATRSGSGFVVQAKEETQATGVKAPTKGVSGRFGWRVVGKRKDIVGARLAKVAAPGVPKVPSAFTIPETPVIKAPTKQP